MTMDNDSIKELIIYSKKAAEIDMEAIHARIPLTYAFFRRKLRDFVLHKYLLKEEELPSEDFSDITELSLSKSMKISPELVKEFDLANSCDGVSSAMAKKVLLFMAIQRELGIELQPLETARLKTLDELADLAWTALTEAPQWEKKIVAGSDNAVQNDAGPYVEGCRDPGKETEAEQEHGSAPHTGPENGSGDENSIAAIQEQIISEFNEIGDSFDQYAYLIELACQLPPLDEDEKTPDRLVSGCQSSVWLKTEIHNGIFGFASDSNTLIVKGILYLLEKLLNGQPCAEVADADISFHTETSIMDTFESSRQKGIGYVIKTLQEDAAKACAPMHVPAARLYPEKQ